MLRSLNSGLKTFAVSPISKSLSAWILGGACLAALPTAMAFDTEALKGLDLSFAAGPTHSSASRSYVQSTVIETDVNNVDNVSDSTTYRVGIGYHLFAKELADRQFFNDFLIQLNYYHDTAAVSGEVWDAGLPKYANQTFRYPYTSQRLMLDLKPTLFTYKQTSFYPILGAGIAWNRTSYEQTATPGYESWKVIDAPSATTKNAVYDYGIGVSSQITKNLSATVEYISNYLGDMSPGTATLGSRPMYGEAPSVSVWSQSVLLGLNWKF